MVLLDYIQRPSVRVVYCQRLRLYGVLLQVAGILEVFFISGRKI